MNVTSWCFRAAVLMLPLCGSEIALAKTMAIKITKIIQHQNSVDSGLLDGAVGDFYPIISINQSILINGFAQRLNYGLDLGTSYSFPWTIFEPELKAWNYKFDVPDSDSVAHFSIFLMDEDDTNDHDEVDVSPALNRPYLNFTVDLNSGRWTGDVASPQNCAKGSGPDAATICFEISLVNDSYDADGDGLLDLWETNGFNPDGDSRADIDLPAMGVSPFRKDVMVEIDCVIADGNGNGSFSDPQDHSHCPTRAAMQDVVTAFAAAPVRNVDGTTGVQLILDVGSLYGAGAVTDVNGPAGVRGRIGDFGGGGNLINEASAQIIDLTSPVPSNAVNFFDLKRANYNFNRSKIFRYSIFGHQTNSRENQNDCTSGRAFKNDFVVTLGGLSDSNDDGVTEQACWTPLSATNLIDEDGDGAVDEDPLNGVDDDGDCTGDTNADTVVCNTGDNGVDEDGGFSVGSQAQVAGTFMHELGHTLNLDHGGADELNNKPNYLSVMNYTFQSCSVRAAPVGSAPVDMTDFPGGCSFSNRQLQSLDETSLDECFGIVPNVFGNIDWTQSRSLEGSLCTPSSANVAADINTDTISGVLPGANDWNLMVYSPTQMAATGAKPLPIEADPSLIKKAREQTKARLQPDLALEITAPAEILPGQSISYQASTRNKGFGPAFDLYLIKDQSLVEYRNILKVQETWSKSVSEPVDAKACPQDIVRTFKVNYLDFLGDTAQSTKSVRTRVLDIVPPTIQLVPSQSSIWPANHKMISIQMQVKAIDNCDNNPAVRLVSITSSDPADGKGDGHTQNDVQEALINSDDRRFLLRAERSGFNGSRVYTIVYEVSDSSGNKMLGQTQVRVGK